MDWKFFLLVAGGGAMGSLVRALIGATFRHWLPWPTLLINVIGAFLIGFFLKHWEHNGESDFFQGFLDCWRLRRVYHFFNFWTRCTESFKICSMDTSCIVYKSEFARNFIVYFNWVSVLRLVSILAFLPLASLNSLWHYELLCFLKLQ